MTMHMQGARGSIRWASFALTWLAVGLWIATFAAPVRAQTCTATMGNVAFGNVDTISGSPTDLSGTIDINCTGYATPSVRVCVSLGDPAGAWDPRQLTGPSSNKLAYNLYKDATRSTVWGSVYDPQMRVMVLDLPVSGGAASSSAMWYGRVSGGQSGVPAGSYSTNFTTSDTLVQAGGYSGSPPACTTSSPPQTQRFSFIVSATVAANCTISTTNVDFGQSGLLASPVNATGVVSTTCTKGSNFTLALNAGSGAGATLAQRRMTRSGGGETLTYALYTDSGRTQVWGDGTGGSSTLANTGTGAIQTSTIYGTLPVQAAPPPGSYVDTVTVTVTF
ncbi:MAG TPA: spore coat protein U domain-containing protein [Lysobacter sp.]